MHAWTAADLVSVAYEVAQRTLRSEGDLDGLRSLYRLTEDKAAEAAMAREAMSQPRQIEMDR